MRVSSASVQGAVEDDTSYDLSVSPHQSVDDLSSDCKDKHSSFPISQPLRPPNSSTITPSIRILFSLLPAKHRLALLTPAIVFSVISGGIAPFMTFVIGQAFDAFAAFPITPDPLPLDKHTLLRAVGFASIELIGLAVGSVALGSVTSSLWIWTGETNAKALRNLVYASVTSKDMAWFDSNISTGEIGVGQGEQTSVGAGGLMSKFTRDTDDVRMATALCSGYLIQYFTTSLTCLVLAFSRSWALTLVILSAVPVLVIIQALSQSLAGPLLDQERGQISVAASIVDRATNAIATVKAFNAGSHEESRAESIFFILQRIGRRLHTVWGVTSALGQFAMMSMFVQGFWFGAKLVREGKVSPGDVMSVFWACLIATSNLQMCIPQFIIFAKGKFAMASLLNLVLFHDSTSVGKLRQLRGIVPPKCLGELALHNVTFAYPSRPTLPVLSHVSLFLPAKEMTFIVGSSGSGKSTVAQLLTGMYQPQSGSVHFDEHDLRFVDSSWTRQHITQVGGNVVIFEGKTFLQNVVAGVDRSDDEVEEACRAALMSEFVHDLPDGLDTILGGGQGVGLSGGQKQRLAIARAHIRNPTILILDEATSALDGVSRVLVFEAIKRWRQEKTTIVITHDLSQITDKDFVYVLKDGRVVQQGYRCDLDTCVGEFSTMTEAQRENGGFVPVDVFETASVEQDKELDTLQDATSRPGSNLGIRPLTFGNWMFEAVNDLTQPPAATLSSRSIFLTRPLSSFDPEVGEGNVVTSSKRRRKPSSIQIPLEHVVVMPTEPDTVRTLSSRRYSLQFTPTSPATFNSTANLIHRGQEDDDDDEYVFNEEKQAMQSSGVRAKLGRHRNRWDGARVPRASINVHCTEIQKTIEDSFQRPPFWKLMRKIFPSVPYKPLLFFGFLLSACKGAITPVFSFLLSRLLFEVSIGARDVSVINKFGAIVLAVAALDGVLLGSKYFVMEEVGMAWATRMRQEALRRVLLQDKKWFDRPLNSPVTIVQKIVKDGDDARNLVSVVWAQSAVVSAMFSVGLVWAMVQGWQLTLVGLAIVPVFAGTLALQTKLVAQCEVRNKRAREAVAKSFYDTILNIKGIRAMAFERVFDAEFNKHVDQALSTGVRGALVEGCSYGVATGLIYLAESLLFYVGAVLIARGLYTYLQMVQVLNLVVFTVTIGSQLMAFTQRIAKYVQSTSDLSELTSLSTDTDENKGISCPPILGPITFSHVDFSYPERPNACVLKNLNFEIAEGECIAIVGASGSGKSTIAALLQRLYEPSAGTVAIGETPLCKMNVKHLRRNVAVVSQQPHLFDASISENIQYGDAALSSLDVRRAAKAANVHDFVMSLPLGYDTSVGENAGLVSGGQAQRLQIARALARPARVLVLDECTSALDPENQAAVLDTVRLAKEGRTTVMVTHKVQVMRTCDRILVLEGGKVAEQGTYDELMARRGVFATLASGGEWAAE